MIPLTSVFVNNTRSMEFQRKASGLFSKVCFSQTKILQQDSSHNKNISQIYLLKERPVGRDRRSNQ